MQDKDSLSKWIETMLIDFVDNSEENSFEENPCEKVWDSPLIGFSSGNDPLYITLKEDIGDFLWTPIEIFTMTFPDLAHVTANDLTVISWALPQTDKTKQDMRKESLYPAKRGTLSRIHSDSFNTKIAKYIIQELNQNGYRAFAPGQSPLWENRRSQKYGYASTWSERHAAFISGLGTFSLTDALITNLGTAVRLGSVIAQISLAPTKREYRTYNANCLFFTTGKCGLCISRCPANAISEKGHDKTKCREYQRTVTGSYILQNYNVDSRYCGLCQFNVPCESCIPKR